jgi:peptidoglycan-N-acetylglucosamine deacetylase
MTNRDQRPGAGGSSPSHDSSASPTSPRLTRRAVLGGICACAATATAGFAAGWAGGRRHEAHRYVSGRPTKTASQRRAAQPDGLFRVHTQQPIVAITLDDGPDPRFTPLALEILGEFEAIATFFVVGVNAHRHAELFRIQQASGHHIGNHTWDHPDLELLDPAAVETEIERTQAELVRLGSTRPTLFRPPKGYTDDAVGVIADANRYTTVFWDVCIERFIDHHPISAGVEQMVRRIQPGSIILGHDGGHVEAPGKPWLNRDRTLKALPILLRRLQREGYRFVDVPTLMRAATLPA